MNPLSALEAAIRMARRQLTEQAPDMDATDLISCAALLPPWQPGVYEAGETRQHQGQPWRCLLSHDSTDNEAWAPGTAPSLWGPCHSKSPKWALPWVEPTGSHDAYQQGEYMVWTDGTLYLCLENGVVHGPDTRPAVWEAQP